jgi:hypothetical protein
VSAKFLYNLLKQYQLLLQDVFVKGTYDGSITSNPREIENNLKENLNNLFCKITKLVGIL